MSILVWVPYGIIFRWFVFNFGIQYPETTELITVNIFHQLIEDSYIIVECISRLDWPIAELLGPCIFWAMLRLHLPFHGPFPSKIPAISKKKSLHETRNMQFIRHWCIHCSRQCISLKKRSIHDVELCGLCWCWWIL